jgi:energy-coupling factor transport system ATP-binding protein
MVLISHRRFYMIKLDKVIYRYFDGTDAVNDLSLDISRGERLSIIGNNGSGKTTLALLISGIIRPTSGEIRIDGLNPIRNEENLKIKRKVGLVFQNPDNQLVSTTVEREIAFSLENLNIANPEIRKRVDSSLRFFGLENFRTRLTSELSGGEKQLLALASVMVAEPEILILDEPGSYLDETGKCLLAEGVKMLMSHNKELTLIRITQYSYVTEDYRRVIVMKDGRIIMDGAPESIYANFDECHRAGIAVPLKYRIEKRIDKASRSMPDSSNDKKSKERIKNIELRNLSFGYDTGDKRIPLFENLNIKLSNDCIYGIVGRSGSGKTTLIQLITGLLKPERGKVQYKNFDPKPGDLVISFQHPERQFFLDTVDKELRFGPENLKLPEIDKIVEDCYHLSSLPKEKFSGRDPFTLSGGEKRRLAFGTILSLRPHFIFFDEPTCGLDFDGICLFKELVRKLHLKGIGITIISHYGDIVFELADEIIPLAKGKECTIWEKHAFFKKYDYSAFLSTPEIVAYQKKLWGEIRYFTESDLFLNRN